MDPDHEWQIVEKFLKYFYTHNFDDESVIVVESPSENPPEAALLIAVKMYIIADKYDVQKLKILAAEKYTAAVPRFSKSIFFISSLRLLYEETTEDDRMLKDVAIQEAACQTSHLLSQPEFLAMCSQRGEISLDILKAASSGGAGVQTLDVLTLSPNTYPVICAWHNTSSCVVIDHIGYYCVRKGSHEGYLLFKD